MKSLLLFVLLLFSFLVVSTADYNDEKLMQDNYCDMVSKDIWGAYDETIECGE